MTLGPAKHEKAARVGRISNVLGLREHKVRSNPQYQGAKYLLTHTSLYNIKALFASPNNFLLYLKNFSFISFD